MIKKIILIFVLIINITNAQSLKLITSVPKDSPYLVYEYGGAYPESFAIDSSIIYMENVNLYIGNPELFSSDITYIWKFKEPLSKTNPEIIIKYSGLNIKKRNNFLVNAALDIYDLKSKEKIELYKNSKDFLRITKEMVIKSTEKFVPEFTDWIDYSLTDSFIYYFGYHYEEKYTFSRYDLYRHKKHEINPKNLLKNIADSSYCIRDIFVSGNKLYYSVLTNSQWNPTTKIVCWDLTEDKKIAEPTLSELWPGERILGMDKWGDLLLFSANDFKNYFTILSPDFKTIKDIRVEPLLNKMEFMKNNDYSPVFDTDPRILSSLNEDQQLFLIVLTKNGLYVLQYDYLPLLKDYYSGKSKDELRILRNTIYAKHGRSFKSEDLNRYFRAQSWYKPQSNYSDDMLTDYDKECVNFIVNIEKEK